MKLKKILALLTILLLALTACKSTEDPVDDKKPLKLSERVGVYKGSISKDLSLVQYAIVEIKNTGEVLYNWSGSPETTGLASTPKLDDMETTNTVLNQIQDDKNAKITFTSKTTIKFESDTLKSQGFTDFINLDKENK